MNDHIIRSLKNGFIVSCQALEGEPLYGSSFMAALAVAAEQGGATAIRANSPQDIAAIKSVCSLPVIGLYKKTYPGYDVYITPTIREVSEVAAAGADLVAIDCTRMSRPDGETLEQLITSVRKRFPSIPIVADISTFEEGVQSMDLGADLISTTMSGYTPYSRQHPDPDIELVRRLSELKRQPVLAEGRIWTIEQCMKCYEAGAYAVVVGTAITRPQHIVKRYVEHIRKEVYKSAPEQPT
ncbi:N-acetylmannosamine-6-phosphate 2-epimerase [Paenibacillus alkalitolerans]|uniref:N-acetylmannosamine-6-phosphate 2-epimerase n=1 Tax=Paenibacillus alkalitolerans TaxID=2799335 RepID=UPI0018F65260|nr:N-acetylmannosamine-6-phosphate 2-epimerase [Paenibacillus alkalitolerans]